MRKYTLRELKQFARDGIAVDITTAAYKSEYNAFDKVGYSSGTYGINGGLLQDPATGSLYVITARNSMLMRIF